MARTRSYRDGVLTAEDFPISEVSEQLGDPAVTLWLDLCTPGRDELHAVGEELGLHSLALEDALQRGQRPKLDRYQEHLFVTAYAVMLDAQTGGLGAHEVNVFITPRVMVTVRGDDGFDIDDVVRRWDGSPDLARYGVSYLLHGVLDYVVDTHFTAVQALDQEIEALEDLVFSEHAPDAPTQRRSFQLRKSLVALRRLVLPMREVVNSLLRRDLTEIDQAMQPYFQDVYDHVLRATEWTESLRDLVTNILETHLTVRGHRQNVIMKQVTSWAAIIAVPTAITGFYGQNVPFPGFGHAGGFWASTVIILSLSALLYVIFRKRGWL